MHAVNPDHTHKSLINQYNYTIIKKFIQAFKFTHDASYCN